MSPEPYLLEQGDEVRNVIGVWVAEYRDVDPLRAELSQRRVDAVDVELALRR
jgi:hypothetical protein